VRQKSSKPTVSDVARIAEVAAITVSRYVNGTSYISAEKKKKIQAAIDKLGYRPNFAARTLKGHRSRIIGVILPDLSDPFFGKCASAIEAYASARGYMTVLLTSRHNRKTPDSEVDMLISQRVAGLIVVPSLSNESLSRFVAEAIPIIALDRPLNGIAADEVVVENLGGAQTAVEHLIGHGYKRIACVGYDGDLASINHRILGYKTAMFAAKLKPELHLSLETYDDVLKLARQWIKSGDHPQALFTLNNVVTRNMLEALREVALPVPQKIALIGFDDIELGKLLTPSLTVVRQPAAGLGNQAARILFDRINGEPTLESEFGIKLVLPVEFVVRNSCGCIGTPAA
jgi:LacI family transcriptional regulator